MSFLHARSAIPYGSVIGPKFLRAARRILREYEDEDLLYPDSSSIQVRMLLSTSIQQSVGENGLAWHFVGEASLIARRLRLYSENVVNQYPPLEATLLRHCFWSLYIADSAGTCMRNRAIVLYEPLFDAELDLATIGFDQAPLLDPEFGGVSDGFEISLLQGFHHIRCNWSTAADLLLAIREYGKRHPLGPGQEQTADATQIATLTNMYSEFNALLDETPPPIQPPMVFEHELEVITEHQQACYKSQRFRVLSIHYCAKLMIMHECSRHGLTAIVGFRNDDASFTNEEINVARDFVHNLQSIPFNYLEENGEPGVELMRSVGSILLEISQNSEMALSRQRALSQLSVLLDILARLDSKASAKLTAELSDGFFPSPGSMGNGVETPV
ncbi:hypothetical protein CEP54_003643 [Fusarium duplospermum]|uniref:Transcription factor domain-containing protein n=1 Tax=Fusarium duplospermum TaxID=1325734 RepID=A0A428QMN8_9HYPO|nr:hypothetical protein CEP54_003643 [Fusarium duplospermum]